MKKNIVVLDTNVLLTDPQAMYKFANTMVIIPQTVLQELDKIKMHRADKTLQYNGRMVSRFLFSISAAGNLQDGVELENGSVIKVVPLEDKSNLPPNLKTKFSDDQILAVAYQAKEANKESDVTIITNDLNMLIKAQSLGLKIEHHKGTAGSKKIKRFIKNQFTSIKKNPVFALFAMLTFGGIIAIIVLLSTMVKAPTTQPELIAQQQMFEAKEKQYIQLLDKNDKNQKARFGLSELYIEMSNHLNDSAYLNKAIDALEQTPETGQRNLKIEAMVSRIHFLLGLDNIAYAEVNKIVKTKSGQAFTALTEQANRSFNLKQYNLAIIFFNKAISVKPKNINTRLDLTQAYYNNNQADHAISTLHKALEIDSKNAIVYYNLGFIYWEKRSDATAAKSYFEKYIELEPKGPYVKLSKQNIEKIKQGKKI